MLRLFPFFALFFTAFFGLGFSAFAQKPFSAERKRFDAAYEASEFSKARAVADSVVLATCPKKEDSTCATWHHLRGNANRALKNSRAAEADFRASLAIRGRSPKRGSEFASSLHGLGTALWEQGRLLEAREILTWSIALRDTLGQKNNRTRAASFNNLGNVAASLGNHAESERHFETALEIFEAMYGVGSREYASSFTNLARSAIALGNLDRAAFLQKKGVEMRRAAFGPDHPMYASALSSLAALQSKIENWPAAIAFSREAIAIHSAHPDFGPDSEPALEDRAKLAEALAQNGQLDEAENEIRAVLNVVESTADSAVFGWAHAIFGQILLKKGQIAAAKAAFEKAIRLQKSILSAANPEFVRSLEGLAETALAEENWPLADSLFSQMQAQDLLEIEAFFPKMSDRERRAFFRPIQRRFERFCSLVWQASGERPELLGRLFDLRLATRGALFSASQKMREQFRASGDLADYEKWLETRERLAGLWLKTATEKQASGYSIPELFEESRRLEKKLRQASPAFWEQTKAQLPDWRLVQLELGADDAALEIIRFRGRKSDGSDSIFYLALALTAETDEQPEAIFFGDGAELETVFFELFRDETRRSAFEKPRPSPSFFAFWAPIRAKIGSKKRVFVAPDGVFHKINLGALRLPTGGFLFDSLDLRTLTSLGDLVRFDQKRPAEKAATDRPTALLIGGPTFDFSKIARPVALEKGPTDRSVLDDLKNLQLAPLPEAVAEIEAVEQLFLAKNWSVEAFSGPDATESAVKKAASPTVAHLATHGLFLKNLTEKGAFFDTSFVSKSPLLRSMLFFAGAQNALDGHPTDGTQDGILTAMEAQNLRLDGTELVVLSACQTADGEAQNGEGVFGLQRAIRVAGARSLLMSLWNVDDAATRLLMTVFYEKWLGGATKNEAFRAAQLAVRRVYPLPAHWASFVLLGE